MLVLQVLISNLYLHTQNTDFLLKISNGCFSNLPIYTIDSLRGPIVVATGRSVITLSKIYCQYVQDLLLLCPILIFSSPKSTY